MWLLNPRLRDLPDARVTRWAGHRFTGSTLVRTPACAVRLPLLINPIYQIDSTHSVIFPKFCETYAGLLRQRTLPVAHRGIAGAVALPALMVILGITNAGLPFAVFLFDLYLWPVYLSQISTALLTGTIIFKNREGRAWTPFWSCTVGLVIVRVLSFISFVGWVIVIFGLLLGFGALELIIAGWYKSWRIPWAV